MKTLQEWLNQKFLTQEEKEQIIKDTFCKYHKAKISLSWVEKDPDGCLRPHHREVIRDTFPDFDMYINNNPSLIANSPTTLKLWIRIPNVAVRIKRKKRLDA